MNSARRPGICVRTDFPAAQRQCGSAQRVTAMMTLTAPQLDNVEDRRSGLSISVAVDVSGSMGGERLSLAVETLQFIMGELQSTDELGIVAYDTNVYERLPMTAMDQAGKVRARAVSDALRAGSSTNLCGGLLASVDQVYGRPFTSAQYEYGVTPQTPTLLSSAARGVQSIVRQVTSIGDKRKSDESEATGVPKTGTARPAERIRAVLLLTDGHANHGPRTAEEIMPLLQRAVEGSASVAVHTFGFGVDHNADLLRAISEVTQGSYYFIGVAEQIKEAFANCLGGLVSVVMQRIVVLCRASGEGVRILQALTKYPTTALPDGAVEVRMADLYSGESRDTLVELEVGPQAAANGPTEIARWSVVYDDTVAGARGVEVGASTMIAFCDGDGRGEADVRVDEQRRRLDVVRALEEARSLAGGGNLDGARAVLHRVTGELAAAPSERSEYVQGLMREVGAVECVLQSQRVWEAEGTKLSNMSMQRHAQQRSNAVSAGQCDAYSTPYQAAMKSKAKKV